MERRNNYEIQAAQARALFCARDLCEVIRRHALRADAAYLYLTLLTEPYRVSRMSGHIERRVGGDWRSADSFDEALTIFDLLCDAKPDRRAAGTWKTTLGFGHHVHRGLLESEKPEPLALLYDRQPELFAAGCSRLGGQAMEGADLAFSLPFFEDLRIALQFWHGDEDFAPRLQLLWDANADQYLKYETMYYAAAVIKSRLREYA